MKKNQLILFVVYLLSFFWYFLFFLVIVPWMVVTAGRSLDYFFFDFLLKGKILPAAAVPPVFLKWLILFGAFLFSVLGLSIIIKALASLRQEGITFPFSVVAHKDLVPSKLVVKGIYSRVRHPMLLGYLFLLIASCLYAKTFLGFVMAVPLLAGLMLETLFLTEEKHLMAWFGQEYQDYRKSTPSLIPKWR